MNRWPADVMMTWTSAPAFTRPRTTSAALYAAIPPATPSTMRDPPRPPPEVPAAGPGARLRPALLTPFFRSPRPSASLLTVVQPRAVGGVRLRCHLGHFLDGVLLREWTVAVRDHSREHFLHGDGHRLVGHRLDARPGAALQLLAALARHGNELELVADVLGRNHA